MKNIERPSECGNWTHCGVNNHDPNIEDCRICNRRTFQISFDLLVSGSVWLPANNEREARKLFNEQYNTYYDLKEHITHGLKDPKIYQVNEEEEVEDGPQER